MFPQSSEQIQAHYNKQLASAAIVAKQNSLPIDLVREFCAAQCPPSNQKWDTQSNAAAWLKEQEISASELIGLYGKYLSENMAIFSKVYANCF
jgi:hypothetical protein